MSVCPNIDIAKFDYLMMSTRFLHYKVTVFSLQVNKLVERYFETV